MVLRLSRHVQRVSCGPVAIIYNRMLGGNVALPSTYLHHLDVPERMTALPPAVMEQLVCAGLVVDAAADENAELAQLQQAMVLEAVQGRLLRCLELSVSEACNYRCRYCTFWRYYRPGSRWAMNEALAHTAIRDFGSVLLSANLPPEPVIYFASGEATLNWAVLTSAARLARELLPTATVSLITNASRWTRSMVRQCRELDLRVGISIDGRPERQIRQRLAPVGLDSYGCVRQLLELGREEGYTFSCLSCTYSSPQLASDVDHVIALAVDNGIPEVDIDYDSGSLTNMDDVRCVVQELVAAYARATQAGLDVFGYWLVPYLNIMGPFREPKVFCGPNKGESICIAADGNVKLCCYEPGSRQEYTW